MGQPNKAKSGISIRRGVIGIVRNQGRYLFMQRAARVARGGYWCFPGGHVERGETSRQAVQRELQEELGIVVIPEQRLGAIRLFELGYILVVWQVKHLQGDITPAPHEVACTRWATAEEIRQTTMGLPSNLEVLAMLGDT